MIIPVLFYIFVASSGIQILYYLSFTSFLPAAKKQKKRAVEAPISILIYAKNKAKKLHKLLPFILDQKYSNYEIVLINDASSDQSLEVMQAFKEKHASIRIVNVKNIEAFWGNKKYALTLGIKAAKHEHLLFTDADCKPISNYWISEMSRNFVAKKSIILGYAKYKRTNTLLNLLVRFEGLLAAMQYFSYARLGNPYMGVQQNLAYTKSAFFNINGFINHMHLKVGDADLFIQDAADKENTTICISENSFIETDAPTNSIAWFQQKRRNIATQNHYKFRHKFFLGLFYISKALFYLLAIFLLFSYLWQIILMLIFTYYFVQFMVVGLAAKKLKEPQLIFFLPFLEVALLFFQFSIFITNLYSKPNHWK